MARPVPKGQLWTTEDSMISMRIQRRRIRTRIRTISRIGCNDVRSSRITPLKKRAPEKAGKKRGKRERLTRRGYLRALCKRDVGPRDLLLLGGAKEKQYT